ncbi:hypothetical protein OHA25_09720 [Nonomuraea sp. NBC_00507]|uniref:hypothetical protein n=1 Tax=Nonomuraea sp. NBC_00507 TaxID=2976002 RepID=UPI002E177B77
MEVYPRLQDAGVPGLSLNALWAMEGAAVRDFRVRHQFTDGDLVCSIVSGELIYDAEDLRRRDGGAARRHGLAGAQPRPGRPPAGPDRRAGLAGVAERDQVDPAEFDSQRQADTDHLGADPAAAFAAVADRSMAAFTAPGALEREHYRADDDAVQAVWEP